MPEVKMGPDGGWAQAFCHYCGWASNALTIDEACDQNEAHERAHPEYREPPTMQETLDALHDHECVAGPCQCKCGCSAVLGCTLLFGPMCSTCMVREMRGDDEHEAPPAADAVDPHVTDTGTPTTREKSSS